MSREISIIKGAGIGNNLYSLYVALSSDSKGRFVPFLVGLGVGFAFGLMGGPVSVLASTLIGGAYGGFFSLAFYAAEINASEGNPNLPDESKPIETEPSPIFTCIVAAYTSPLILDLDGDGVEAGGVALFDHEGDGFAELTRWVGEDDGMLVWDRNGDGVINDGTELFGDNTVLANSDKASHGFAALAELDSNGDGVVDANDANFAALQILRWSDTDGDGEQDAMELVSLADVGVQSLNTGYVDSDYVDEHGNEHRQVGSFTKADGTAAAMADVWFVREERLTGYDRSGIPEHSEAIASLPEVRGSGRVYNLRDAMALDDAGRLSAPFCDGERSETRALRELAAALGGARDGASCPLLWTGGGKKAGKAGFGLDFWR